ncbi:MAG: hypothetical protein MJ078_07165, partial [Clostridia bacterium]|nr:hypothetical protein [Clostridia bacterium]
MEVFVQKKSVFLLGITIAARVRVIPTKHARRLNGFMQYRPSGYALPRVRFLRAGVPRLSGLLLPISSTVGRNRQVSLRAHRASKRRKIFPLTL